MFLKLLQSSPVLRPTTCLRPFSSFRTSLRTSFMPPQRDLHFVRAVDTVMAPDAVDALQKGLDIDEEPFMLSVSYGPFGYFPMTLGKNLPQDYHILRKLGWARNSSVWLAEDTGSHRYAAVKILTVNATNCLTYKLYHEHKVYAILKKNASDPHPGRAHCIQCICMFLANSVHGTHACFATPVYGSTIGDLLESQPQRRFNLGTTKKIVKQALLGLDYLHTVINVVHGDIKPESLLVDIDIDNNLDVLSEYLESNPATTYPPRINATLWPEPMVTVRSQPLPNFGLHPSLDNINSILCDYGGAVPTSDITSDTAICGPAEYRAPELTLGHEWSTGVDIWSVGCMAFQFLTGTSLFDYDADGAQNLAYIAELIGPFPQTFLSRCAQRGEYFDEDNNILKTSNRRGSLEERIECLKATGTSDADIRATCAFLRRCLTIDPSDRANASQLLEDEWLEPAVDSSVISSTENSFLTPSLSNGTSY